MTRILFVGDAAATGFGTVTQDLGRALLDLGEDVRFLSMNMTEHTIPEPLGSRTYALDPEMRPETIVAILTGGMPDGWNPEAIIVLGDFFAARWLTVDDRLMEALQRVPSFHYCPIEGVDLPPGWRTLWDVCKPVAMSRFGQAEMAKVMGYQPPMIYHGVDTEVFYPIAPNHPAAFLSENGSRPSTKAAAKAHFGMNPDRLAILRTDRHMPRKRYNALLRALYPVLEKHPDTDLVIHCKLFDQGGYLFDTLTKYPDWFRRRVLFTLAHDTYKGYDREELNILYNAADLYCSVSAEGFGLTIAEAVACGIPAVGIDYSAVPEVIGPAGMVAPVSHLLDNEYDHFWAAIDENAYAAIVDRLLSKPSLRRSLGSAGPAHVRANFQWSTAARQFADLIHEAVRSEAA